MTPPLVVRGFVAGLLAVIIFQQAVIFVLHTAGIALATAWDLKPDPPLGIPPLALAALWGGLCGIVLALALYRFRRGPAYWPVAVLFGAVVPTLLALLVVVPSGSHAINGAVSLDLLISAVANAAWGAGAAFLLLLL